MVKGGGWTGDGGGGDGTVRKTRHGTTPDCAVVRVFLVVEGVGGVGEWDAVGAYVSLCLSRVGTVLFKIIVV